jgi:hypothetical protein
MRHLLAGMVAGALLLGGGAAVAAAQETKWVRGTVSDVGPDSITVKVRDREMKFAVDAKTDVMARGAGTKTRAAQAQGQKGAKLTEVVKAGESVEVRYHEAGMHAANIRVLTGSVTPATSEDKPEEPKASTASGTVTAVSGTSLSIKTGSGETTFTVDSSTKVVGTGLGTKAREEAAAGKKTVITDFVKVGDTVNVSYHEMAGAKQAAEVHVTRKAMK